MTKQKSIISWQEITNPDESQRRIFESSKDVYYKLFSSEHQEDWSNFKEYIFDAKSERYFSRPEAKSTIYSQKGTFLPVAQPLEIH